MEALKYTIRDVVEGKMPHDYVAAKNRLCKMANLDAPTTVRFIFNGLDPELRDRLGPSTTYPTPESIVRGIVIRKDTWMEIFSRYRRYGSTRPQEGSRNSYQNETAVYRSPAVASAPIKTEPSGIKSFEKFRRKDTGSVVKIKQERRSTPSPKKPCFTCGSPDHWNADCPKNPAATRGIYLAEVTDDPLYDEEQARYVYDQYGSLTDQKAKWSEEQETYFLAHYDRDDDDAGVSAFFAELEDDEAIPTSPVAVFSLVPLPPPKDVEVVEVHVPQKPSGMSYRGSHHAQVWASFDKDVIPFRICPDSGSGASLIDRALLVQNWDVIMAASPDGQLKTGVSTLKMKGVGAKTVASSEFVTIRIFLHGQRMSNGNPLLAAFQVELHVVDNLSANVLLGNDFLLPARAVLDFEHACLKMDEQDLAVPMQVHKDQLTPRLSLKAQTDSIIPADSISFIPFRGNVPTGQDYFFEPHIHHLPPEVSLLGQLIKDQTSVLLVANWSQETAIIAEGDVLGALEPHNDERMTQIDGHFHPMAERSLFAEVFHFRLREKGTLEELEDDFPGLSPRTETLSDDEILQKLDIHPDAEAIRPHLRPFVSLWRPSSASHVKQPVEDFLQIPLVEGWEKKVKATSSVYRLSPEDRALVDEVFDGLHAEGKMKWCRGAPFGWPVFVVWKGSGPTRKGRVVVDVRGLNAISVPDVYPLPHRDDLIASVFGCPFLTSVDMTASFYQFPVNPAHQDRLSVITHRGHETFKVAVMGYLNSVAHVQRFGEQEFRDFLSFLKIYVDHWLVHSQSLEEHIQHCSAIFSRMLDKEVSLSLKKTHIGYPSLVHLGFLVDRFGLSTAEEKVQAIRNLEFPRTLRELEMYLGLTGYLRHFVPYYATLAAPLQQRKVAMLKAYRPKSDGSNEKDMSKLRKQLAAQAVKEPTVLEKASFQELQAVLGNPLHLAHQNPDLPLLIDLDASKDRGYGVMLYHLKLSETWTQQLQANATAEALITRPSSDICPVLFLSKELNSAERNYHATELELSCAVWVVRKCRHLIEASPRTIMVTDHAASSAIVNQVSMRSTSSDKLNLRLIRASQYLSQFRHKLELIYKPGRLHKVPDALSRLLTVKETSLDFLPVSPTVIRKLQPDKETPVFIVSEVRVEHQTEFLHRMLEGYKTDSQYSKFYDPTVMPQEGGVFYSDGALTITKDTKTDLLMAKVHGVDHPRICVPKTMYAAVFQLGHDWVGHLGYHRLYDRISQVFYIPKLSKRLRQYVLHCPQCQHNQTLRLKPPGLLNPIPSPFQPYSTVTIDIFLGLPEHFVTGNDAVLSVTDKCSREQAFVPGRSNFKAEDWAHSFYMEVALKRRWGLPNIIISDRDPKFTSDFWQRLFTLSGTRLALTTAYHAQADGQSEKSNEIAIIGLRFYLAAIHMADGGQLEEKDWELFLGEFEAVCNNSVNSSTGQAPNMVIRGFLQQTGLELMARPEPPTPSVDADEVMMRRMLARQDARDSVAYANFVMKHRFDKSHRDLQFQVGDSAFINIYKGYDLPSDKVLKRKFNVQRVGPFKVLERIGRGAYRLDLPPHFKMHNVLSVAQLAPVPPGPDPYGRPTPSNPIVTAEGNQVEVERILQRRRRPIGKTSRLKTEYLVKWKDYGPEHDQWVPEEDLGLAQELLDEFNQQERARPQLVRSRPQTRDTDDPPGLRYPPGRPAADPIVRRERAIAYTRSLDPTWNP